jgi:transposase-like protein
VSDIIIAQHQEVIMRAGSPSRFEHYKRLIELRRQKPEEPLSQFCRENGISTWTYYFWRKKIIAETGRNDRRQTVQTFVPVRLESNTLPSHSLEIVLPNGIRVRSGQPLDRELLSVLAGA